MITANQVKSKLGIAVDNQDYDSIIDWNINTYESILIVDYFGTADVINNFTADQRIRLELGLITYISGKVLEGITSGNTTDFGGSVHVGPISISDGAGAKISANKSTAKNLLAEGHELLETLRLYFVSNPSWGAV